MHSFVNKTAKCAKLIWLSQFYNKNRQNTDSRTPTSNATTTCSETLKHFNEALQCFRIYALSYEALQRFIEALSNLMHPWNANNCDHTVMYPYSKLKQYVKFEKFSKLFKIHSQIEIPLYTLSYLAEILCKKNHNRVYCTKSRTHDTHAHRPQKVNNTRTCLNCFRLLVRARLSMKSSGCVTSHLDFSNSRLVCSWLSEYGGCHATTDVDLHGGILVRDWLAINNGSLFIFWFDFNKHETQD